MISCIESTPASHKCKDCVHCDHDPANPAKMGLCKITDTTVRTNTITRCTQWRSAYE